VDSNGPVDWSPAGGWLAYRASVDGGGNILKVPVDDCGNPTGDPLNVTNHGAECYDDQPTWSPDGEWIAFERKEKLNKNRWGPTRIFRMRANGTDVQDLGAGRNPEWSPWLDTVAPTAVAGGPYAEDTGVPVTFSGSGSDPDGTIEWYVWDFGDGSPRARAEGAQVEHTYEVTGTYDVRLIVVDNDNVPSLAAFTTAVISGPNDAPIADAGGPYNGEVGAAITFDGSGSYDPNGDQLWYQWDFGDDSPLTDWTTDPTATHTYVAPDVYDVFLWVDDGKEGGLALSVSTATVTLLATMHISNVDAYYRGGHGKFQTCDAYVYVVDASGDPVEGADVTGQWTWDGGSLDPTTHTTNASGLSINPTDYLKDISGKVLTFTVTDVVKDGWVYDPDANVESSDSVSVP
jgi:hypothetical protein